MKSGGLDGSAGERDAQDGAVEDDREGRPGEDAIPEPRAMASGSARSLADRAFALLRDWVINGQLHPGYPLRVREVADLLGTSVMPAREAVSRLVDAGLAEQEPYKSARVRRLSVQELEEVYSARILVEGECANLGSTAIAAAELERMEQLHEELLNAASGGDARTALTRDEEMLDILYSAGGNGVLLDIVRGLWDRCRPYKMLWATQGDGLNEHIWRYKTDLIDAARAGDGERAREIIRVSYQRALDAIREMLGTQELPGITTLR